MNSASNPATTVSMVLAAMAWCLAAGPALAAEAMPDTENGRYSLSPSADGVVRLDTRTGTVSNCSKSDVGWACYALPDERKALEEEIGRLQGENDALKAQLAERSPAPQPKISEALPKSDKGTAPRPQEGERKIEIPLPSDADMDRVMSFLERAWRRLVDMANQMQKDATGKI